MKTNFPTFHCHPQSLDSASTPESFLERELELGTGTITATDHGSLVATRKLYDLSRDKKACKGQKITPILGCEIYLRDDSDLILIAAGIPKVFYDKGTKDAEKYPNGTFREFLSYTHVTLHFLDQAAYETGIRLLSKADERAEKHGSERKPLFDWAALEELGAQNVTVGSGCLIGAVPRLLLGHNNLDLARQYYQKLKSTFKPGNFYVEVMPHKCDTNFESGIFFEMADGTKFKHHADKLLRTNAGEIKAEQLAAAFAKPDNKHKTLIGVSNYRVWQDLPPVDFVSIVNFEGFRKNECRKWSPDGDLQKGINRTMIALARQYGDKVIISDDSHFATPDYKIVQDVRLAQSGSWRMSSSYHRQSSDEAFATFKETLGTTEAQFEGWVQNNVEWADRFKNFKLTSEISLPTKFYTPNYCEHPWHSNPKVPEKDHSLMYTMELIKKHGRMDWKNPIYVARLQAEIKLLHNNDTIDLLPYFFIGEEACDLYAQNGQLTGPGRGSAAGLLLAYLLSITHVDPIWYNLSVDRFLTLDRVKGGKYPDIDMDFGNRDLLLNPETGWLTTRFGDHQAQLSVDISLKLKSAVKDVARMTRGEVPADIEGWTRKFLMPPQGVSDHNFVMGYEGEDGVDVKGSSEPGHSGYDATLGEYMRTYPEDWKIVQKCLGLSRSKGRHACSWVIANKPISSFIPMTTVSDVQVTSYTAASVEAVGGLKLDFLTVNSIADIQDCIKLIQSRSGCEIPVGVILNGKKVPSHRLVPTDGQVYDIWDLPEDQSVFADIATGKTETVFQFGTPSAQQWMRHFAYQRPNGTYAIDSILAMATFTALDRPGPLDMLVIDPDGDGRQRHNQLVEYARRARGAEPSTEIPQIMNELVPETLGVLCFQESLQRAYQKLTGCTGPEAEEFRSNVAKKKKEKVDAAESFFMPRATEKVGEANAKAIWNSMVTFGQYGFNLSHAVCYSVIGYSCAYLKHYFPLEWWTSVLKNADKNEVNERFWRHAGHLIDLPDVIKSGPVFEIQGDRIRAPLSLLHGVGDAAHAQLVKGLPYVDIFDFCLKQEQYRYDTGKKVTKTKIVKEKVLKATKKRPAETIPAREETSEVLKLGHSSLNRGIVYTMILSGAMDSLFPVETMVSDKMQMFEVALAQAKTELGPIMDKGKYIGQKKPVKVEPVDPKYLNLRALTRYQMCKEILPAYGANLTDLLVETKTKGVGISTNGNPIYEWMPPRSSYLEDVELVSYKRFEELSQDAYIEQGDRLYVAVAAYVLESKTFSYVREGETKNACKLQLDVEGARVEFVKWPSKDGSIPDIFRQTLAGAVVIAVLVKWSSAKPFSVEDLIVIEPPLGAKEAEKEESKEPEEEAA